MASISAQKYEELKRKAFYIKQNPAQFVDAILDAVGVAVEAPTAEAGAAEGSTSGNGADLG